MILENEKPSGSSQWQTRKVYTLQPGAIGFIIAERDVSGGIDLWYHYDRLGNVMARSNTNGQVQDLYDQEAFGTVLSGDSSGYHLTTKEYFPEIGLYYFYQRWYDSEISRFLSKDKLRSSINYSTFASF